MIVLVVVFSSFSSTTLCAYVTSSSLSFVVFVTPSVGTFATLGASYPLALRSGDATASKFSVVHSSFTVAPVILFVTTVCVSVTVCVTVGAISAFVCASLYFIFLTTCFCVVVVCVPWPYVTVSV